VIAIGVQGAEAISGNPRVVDGDSLKFGSVAVRLHGIDAPESDQVCSRNGQIGDVVSRRQLLWLPWWKTIGSIAQRSTKIVTVGLLLFAL
jgi:hypothetical protein